MLTDSVAPWYRRIEAKIFVAIIAVVTILGGTFWYIDHGQQKNSNTVTKIHKVGGESGGSSQQSGVSSVRPHGGQVHRVKKAVRTIRVGRIAAAVD